MKQRQARRTLRNSTRNLSISNGSELVYSSTKSGISTNSWTLLSNDPFSQIEANTSVFTEITDQSTISRSSLYADKNRSLMYSFPPSYHATPSGRNGSTSACMGLDYFVSAESIRDELSKYPNDTHRIIKQFFNKIQEQKDAEDWEPFYLAIDEFSRRTQHPIAIFYLARCFIYGLGVETNIEYGLHLLRSQSSCEASYALGLCYLDGLPVTGPHTILEVNKPVAFEYFSTVVSYSSMSVSPETLDIIAEAQCIMARMLFQGDGVNQNSEEAFELLLASANNNNIYAQFLVGVHYERGIDVPQNLEKGKEYYCKSARQNFADAQAALGIRLIAEEQYIQGVEWLEKAVVKGNSRAHVLLGILHEKGEGVEQNDDIALVHYKAAVEKNNSSAQYILGLIFYFGRLGRQKNYKEAIRLIKLSANSGFPYAQRVLGQLYQQGNLSIDHSSSVDSRYRTRKNEKEAIRWYKRAAAGKDILALGILGNCHENGTGVDVDYERALYYYAKAAEQDSAYVYFAKINQALLLQKMSKHLDAFRVFSYVAHHADHIKDDLSLQTAQLSIARYHLCHNIEGIPYHPQKAVDMLTTLTQTTNNAYAHYWLGSCYDEGIADICEMDRQKAFYHFRMAAEAGDVDATFLVAYMMSNHVIPEKGPADALPWYEKAALKGHRISMYSVGLCYYKGIGLESPNLDTALEWFEKAARVGVPDALSYIARIYLHMYMANTNLPELSQQYFENALVWLKKAANKNDAFSQRELGKIYLTGKGLTADYAMAVELLSKAAQKKDPEAIAFLGNCYQQGTGVEKDSNLAIEYYLQAASLGYSYAYFLVAELYYESGNMNLSYEYYYAASKEPKLLVTKTGKTAKMMVARLSLGYISPSRSPPIHVAVDSNVTISSSEAFDILFTLVTQDNFIFAYQPLAWCYLNGKGTPINMTQGLFWFRKAADDLNDSNAMLNLSEIYCSIGVHSNLEMAKTYLCKSAELGCPEAQYRMGIMFLEGKYGMPINEPEATRWFRKAAENSHVESLWILSEISNKTGEDENELQYQKSAAALGHVLAMRTLGQKCLALVTCSFIDALLQKEYLDEGLKYLHMAADSGDTESLVILGHAYSSCIKTGVEFTNHVDQSYLPSPSDTYSLGGGKDDEDMRSRWQSEEDEKKLAIECFEQASALGDLNATVLAGEAWHEQKQYAAALEYFEKASARGSVVARFFCARYCIEGHPGSPQNPEKGFQELLICANELNCIHAYNTLGQCYENGIGTKKDDALAFQWYLRAAQATNDSEAFYRMARMYIEERISLLDTESKNKDMEAFKLYNMAVNHNSHGSSCYEIAIYYLNGIFHNNHCLLSPNPELVVKYLRKASELNVEKAMLELGLLFLNTEDGLDEHEEGLGWLKRAAELGLAQAQFELGQLYHLGKEVILVDDTESEQEYTIISQDFEKAYDLFCRSAAQKHPTATYYLGLYHQHGIFVAPDVSIAIEQYQVAIHLYEFYQTVPHRWQAEYNLGGMLHQDVESRLRAYELFQLSYVHSPDDMKYKSEIMLSRYHLYGWAGVPIQAEEAFSKLLLLSQHEKHGDAVFLDIAHCFETGTGVAVDYNQAFYWYNRVIRKSSLSSDSESISDDETEDDETKALFKLAEFYQNGVVVEIDSKKAKELYTLAASRGSKSAQERLSFTL
ncbi:HCP-like protein [Backusella circina FSU 941]|nr:HCP-like protein [Backusella circina FSU 941]